MRKVDIGRQMLEAMKSQGLKVTKASVASLANISRSLLSPQKDGSYKSKEWEQLANEIIAYQTLTKSTKTSDNYRNKIKSLQNARDDSDRKYRAQVEQNTALCAEMVELRRETYILKSAYAKLVDENDKLLNQCRSCNRPTRPIVQSQGVMASIASSTVISTDEELLLITGKQYRWDSLLARQAHTYAQKKLKLALSRPIPKRLYLVIGRPGAGKSTWIMKQKAPPFSDGRLSIYYDATNASVADRWEIMEITRESLDTVVCYVYFDVDIMTCITNSKQRTDKFIPDNIIRDFRIDPPELNERYNELIIVSQLVK